MKVKGGAGTTRLADGNGSYLCSAPQTTPVAELFAKAQEPADRAAFDRLIDVPLPNGKLGAFENLHGSDTRIIETRSRITR